MNKLISIFAFLAATSAMADCTDFTGAYAESDGKTLTTIQQNGCESWDMTTSDLNGDNAMPLTLVFDGKWNPLAETNDALISYKGEFVGDALDFQIKVVDQATQQINNTTEGRVTLDADTNMVFEGVTKAADGTVVDTFKEVSVRQ